LRRLANTLACRPLPQLGSYRSGAGIPDAAVAAGVAPWGSYSTLSSPAAQPAAGAAASSRATPEGRPGLDALDPLEAAMRSAGLIPSWGSAP
jgi:hypothetical protein